MERDNLLEGFQVFLKDHEFQGEENKALRTGLQEIAERLKSTLQFIEDLGKQLKHPNPLFDHSTDDYEWSVRTYNSLKNLGVKTVGDIVRKTEDEFLRVKNFGRKSLKELKGKLAIHGLWLGMTETEILHWTPPDPKQ